MKCTKVIKPFAFEKRIVTELDYPIQQTIVVNSRMSLSKNRKSLENQTFVCLVTVAQFKTMLIWNA